MPAWIGSVATPMLAVIPCQAGSATGVAQTGDRVADALGRGDGAVEPAAVQFRFGGRQDHGELLAAVARGAVHALADLRLQGASDRAQQLVTRWDGRSGR